MSFSDQELLEQIPKRDLRAVARLITLCESRAKRGRDIQVKLFAKTGRAHVIGITGSPGAGKSTLVDQLARLYRKQGLQVGVLAIDPTSPFSGGAILGDRIRMARSAEDQEIYIRSMATRGALGGVSHATLDAVMVLDSAGFDVILVETVGVGQAEVDIMRLAHTCAVVLVPGMGDSVQSMKAGVLEIADIFVINKADREGADQLQKELRVLLSLSEYKEGQWTPQIVRTVATSGEGVEELVAQSVAHKEWLKGSEEGKRRQLKIIEESILKIAADLTREKLLTDKKAALQKLVLECYEKKTDPFSAVEKLVGKG